MVLGTYNLRIELIAVVFFYILAIFIYIIPYANYFNLLAYETDHFEFFKVR